MVGAVKAVEKRLIAKIRTDQDALTKRVDAVESQMKALELQVKGKDVELENKQKLMNKLQTEVESLCNQHDDLEQYGRRQSIRLHNVSHEGCADSEEAALKMFNVTMTLKVSAEEIERVHPLGPKQTIVKFESYKTKAAVYKAKSNLKDNHDGVFMTEDLTKRNYALLAAKKANKIHSFWTIDGKIFMKFADVSKLQTIRSQSDITVAATTPGTEAEHLSSSSASVSSDATGSAGAK